MQRFEGKLHIHDSGCWLWTAYVDEDGYGRFRLHGRWRKAHRVAYELYIGPIPNGLEIDHLCRVRHCVNPDHLELVTRKENIRRSLPHLAQNGANNRVKTCCPRGHAYDDSNTYRAPKTGQRHCRLCRREYMKRYHAKQR